MKDDTKQTMAQVNGLLNIAKDLLWAQIVKDAQYLLDKHPELACFENGFYDVYFTRANNGKRIYDYQKSITKADIEGDQWLPNRVWKDMEWFQRLIHTFTERFEGDFPECNLTPTNRGG